MARWVVVEGVVDYKDFVKNKFPVYTLSHRRLS